MSGSCPILSLLISDSGKEVKGGNDAKHCSDEPGRMSGLFPAVAWPQDAATRKKAEDPVSHLPLARVLCDFGKKPSRGVLNSAPCEDDNLVMNPGALFEVRQ